MRKPRQTRSGPARGGQRAPNAPAKSPHCTAKPAIGTKTRLARGAIRLTRPKAAVWIGRTAMVAAREMSKGLPTKANLGGHHAAQRG